MMLTETDAKTKACCKGSEYSIQQNGACIGSACMAWRWEVRAELGSPHPSGYNEVAFKRTGLGYCGLAGRPDQGPVP